MILLLLLQTHGPWEQLRPVTSLYFCRLFASWTASMREHPHQSMTSSDHILATFYSILPFTIPSNTVVAEKLKLCTNTILLGNSIWYNITSVISFANISDGKPRGTASSRGSIFTVLVLVLRVTILVSVLVLHLLSWSCALLLLHW